ncbi:discoidin domain-containing protein [Paenibacillus sp. FSL K6-1318]|uniref:discoidin domain-containing protein n=1 Tax=Paenibacillus sp. FSL K6-1318 TaxID=2975291 RepID=UPI0030EBBA0B
MATIGQVLTEPEVGWKRYDDTEPSFEFIGSWLARSSNSGYYNSTGMFTTYNVAAAIGSKVRFNFTGSKLRIIQSKAHTFSGSIDVYIDGKLIQNYSTTGSTTVVNQILTFEVTNLTFSRHYVEIINKTQLYLMWDAIDIDENGNLSEYKELVSKILLSSGDKVVSIRQGSPQENLVPAMTNYTLPSGTVEASSTYSSYYAWKAFDKVNDSYGWLSNGITGWLKYTFPLESLVQAYTIKSGDNSTTRTPKSWTFEGSNDGSSWTVLDSRVNETNWSTGEKRTYVFKNITKFLMYRINVTSNNGDTSYVSIGEMEMMELGLSTLKFLPNNNETTFSNEGMQIGNLSELADKIKIYASNSVALSSGKIFEHTINMSKRRVDKIMLS